MTNIPNKLEQFAAFLNKSKLEHKEYQFDGLRWCLNNESEKLPLYNIRGGFIADEMGLGKTILMIGLTVTNFVKRTLIVLPPILIAQWSLQFYRTTGHKPLIYYGTANKKKITLAMLQNAPITITSYNSLIIKKGTNDSLLHQVKWSRTIYDEAHHLRNKKTQLFQAAKQLKTNICWLVSGTPVQNNIKDFYSLCTVLGLPPTFHRDPKNLQQIANTFILKRTKKEVGIPMPELQTKQRAILWSNEQKELSESIHAAIQDAGQDKLVMIMLAKQSCIMNRLLKRHTDRLKEFGLLQEKEQNQDSLEERKIDQVVKTIVKNRENGNGKIVFCHFREEMDEIAKRLQQNEIHRVEILDGRLTGTKKRQDLLSRAPEVLILQIQTCCEGLNLQEHYSEVYFVSPHWNPAVEEQAIARCHRIGQKKEVVVHRFAMESFDQDQEQDQHKDKAQDKEEEHILSMDHYIMTVQEKKRNINFY
jgi:SNF2 family DNA or RNA helicase